MELLTQIHVVYFLPPYRPRYVSTVFFVKKKSRPSFQSTHFTRKSPRDLLILELVIVNTIQFILILSMIQG